MTQAFGNLVFFFFFKIDQNKISWQPVQLSHFLQRDLLQTSCSYQQRLECVQSLSPLLSAKLCQWIWVRLQLFGDKSSPTRWLAQSSCDWNIEDVACSVSDWPVRPSNYLQFVAKCEKKNAILSQSLICFLFSSSCKEVDVLFYCGWPLRRRTRFHVDMCGYHVCVMEIEVRESVIYITKISSVSVHLSLFVTTSCGIFICHLLIVPAPYYFYQFPVALV